MAEFKFKYHPDPLGTDAFKNDKTVLCSCCGLATDVYYDKWFYSSNLDYEYDVNFCPKCIASGKAVERFGGEFQLSDNVDDVSDPEKLDELLHRTPGSPDYQGYWVAHCGDYCAYVGAIDGEELEESEFFEEIRETYREDIIALDFEDFVQDAEHCTIHLYKCLHCGKHIAMMEQF